MARIDESGSSKKRDEDGGYHSDGDVKKNYLALEDDESLKKLRASSAVRAKSPDGRLNISPSQMGTDCYRLKKIDWI